MKNSFRFFCILYFINVLTFQTVRYVSHIYMFLPSLAIMSGVKYGNDFKA